MSDPVLVGRAAQVVVAALTARFLPLFKTERAAFGRFLRPTLRNWNGFDVGALRACLRIVMDRDSRLAANMIHTSDVDPQAAKPDGQNRPQDQALSV